MNLLHNFIFFLFYKKNEIFFTGTGSWTVTFFIVDFYLVLLIILIWVLIFLRV